MKRARILYAEDDETLSFITKDHLELQGYEIRHCGDGKKTLDEFNLDQFDLVILDVMLPGMDGFSIAEAIRRKITSIWSTVSATCTGASTPDIASQILTLLESHQIIPSRLWMSGMSCTVLLKQDQRIKAIELLHTLINIK